MVDECAGESKYRKTRQGKAIARSREVFKVLYSKITALTLNSALFLDTNKQNDKGTSTPWWLVAEKALEHLLVRP